MNLIDFFDAGARDHPDAPFLARPGGSSVSYRNARRATVQIAAALQRLGAAPGFHGAVLGGNDPEVFTVILGIARAGGAWLPLNTRNSIVSNIEYLRDMDCDVLFYQQKWQAEVEGIRRAVGRIRIFICIDAAVPRDHAVGDWLRDEDAAWTPLPWNPEATAAILATGGTTGRSKGVMLSNRNIAAMCANMMAVFDVTPRMNYLAAAPITHTAGLLALPFMARGGQIVMVDGIEPQSLLRTMAAEKINVVFLPPTVIYVLLGQPGVRDHDFSALRYLLYGAAPMSPDKLVEAIGVFGPVMMQAYGQSEAPGTISVLRCEDHFADRAVAPRQRLLSAGRPFPFTRVAIMDDEGSLIAEPGESGEIVVQGDLVTSGYYGNPAATEAARRNGWHLTGDVGYIDAQGYLYVVDRKKDMIITGGFNVYSTEVEAALMAHPAVKDCAVIGIPDAKWGEAIKGFVELRAGETADEEEIIRFARERLGGVKTPKSVEIVDMLPRSSVGKVLKKEIRARYWSGQERAI